MTREIWREFVCSPTGAGRHLSSIGRGVSGSYGEAIDHAELIAFLDRLTDSGADTRYLSEAIDLIVGGYAAFCRRDLHKLLDSMSNEMLSVEQVVGPALVGNPRWDRTLLRRSAGNIRRTQFVTRTANRTFDLPENQLVAWLVQDLLASVAKLEARVGTAALHQSLSEVRKHCEAAKNHHWLESITLPSTLVGNMLSAAARQRVSAYGAAASLARRRAGLQARDPKVRLYNTLALLAVNWLEPVSDDDLFELYILVLVIDIFSSEFKFGLPEEYGLIGFRGRSHVALFKNGSQEARIYFDQSPAQIVGSSSKYADVVARHNGLSGGQRRPDITVIYTDGGIERITFIEIKRTADGKYIADSIYKVFAYLYDYADISPCGTKPSAILVVPEGISSIQKPTVAESVHVVSGDNRSELVNSLAVAIGADW